MWALNTQHPSTVYINFRSEGHVRNGGSEVWLRAGGWALDDSMESAVSSGIPNGPYSGPVYSKRFDRPCRVELLGSDNWEGTYFVFLELHPPATAAAAAAAAEE